jgi:hypothetical protein
MNDELCAKGIPLGNDELLHGAHTVLQKRMMNDELCAKGIPLGNDELLRGAHTVL